MNKNLKLVALAIAAIFILTPLISGVKAASWQTVNNDPNLCSASAWSTAQINTWPGSQQLGTGSATAPSNWFAWTMRDMRGNSNTYWGNTEFAQGYKPVWGLNPYGQPFNPIPLTATVMLSATAKLAATPVSNNAANVYIDVWCMFTGPVGRLGLQNMELIIYLGEYGPSTQCSPGTYFQSARGDGNGNYWYFAGYRVPSNIGTSYSTNQAAISDIVILEANAYGITSTDLANGGIVGLTFGVETSNAYLSADWSYVNLQQYK